MAKYIETFRAWTDSCHADVAALKKLLEQDGAHADSRKLAAGALNYLVQRLDLVPDHNEGIGALDDVMVMRVCVALAQAHPLGDLPGDAEHTLAKLGNDSDSLLDFLGGETFGKLKQYCAKLAETPVRGRTPQQIISDPAIRKAFYVDVEEELKRSVPVAIKDPDDAELRLKAYLTHKLK